MFGGGSVEVERKVNAILRVLSESNGVVGARLISRELKKHGIDLSERAVRYHLKLMDERGLTRLVGRDGRQITQEGMDELRDALVGDKVGFFINRIEVVSFRTTFDWRTRAGLVPANVSIFSKDDFPRALKAMAVAFKAGLSVGNLVAVANEGERLGERVIPKGRIGFATVCSAVVTGALLKAGVPMDSKFGGILQIKDRKPLRFAELIYYSGTSLDPSEVFIRGKMTDVIGAAKNGDGKVLANFAEVPGQCRSLAEDMTSKLKEVGLGSLMVMGKPGEPVCEAPVDPNRVGVLMLGGLNPVAAAEEAGIQAENAAISAVVEYSQLKSFWDLL
ncbi:MAG: NrpR regulatory domain-containing protein [Dehalococcoidia bacterium]|nr:NrpR regulatory domain-containing protein [Dehalococcoidia bacterium]